MNIAVVLFAYQRPGYLKKCLESIKDAYCGDMVHHYYAFIDYSWMQDEIAEIIKGSGLFDNIIKREKKYGCDRNIINGIDEIFKTYDAVIVLEDDLILKPDTLEYLAEQLNTYKDNCRIGAVTANKGRLPHQNGWGWAWGTWKKKWDVKLDGRTWDMSAVDYFKSYGLYAIFSPKKRVKHIGNKGTHFNILSRFGIRKHFRKWKENYYRDKDVMMVRETLLTRFYRIFI